MEKPTDLLVVDTRNDIIKIAQESKLPLSILEMIFAGIYRDIEGELKSNLPLLKNQYEESLKEETKKNGENKK